MTRDKTLTAQYMRRLRRLAPGRSMRLHVEDGAYGRLPIWRHAAKKLGRSIQIKTLRDGVRIYG